MSFLIDVLSIISIIGIWPRFIEPKMVSVSEITWHLKEQHAHLDHLTIVHISDLHFHKRTPQKFLNKIVRLVCAQQPDLILFTGDFLCYAQLEDQDRLKHFLQQLTASIGCYCIFGNHDYEQYVSLNREGVYDISQSTHPIQGIMHGLKTIFCAPKYTSHRLSKHVFSIPHHQTLCTLLKQTPFQLLENTTIHLPIGLNITGLGDLALGRCLPKEAFVNYNPDLPGLILSHNPDSFSQLINYPGDWILSGHTHGEQIHFFWPKVLKKMSQKLTRLESMHYTRGLFSLGNKQLYVNRGLGCHKPFRFCSLPEICVIRSTLRA